MCRVYVYILEHDYSTWELGNTHTEVSRTRKFGLRLVNFADGQPSLSPRMCVKSINHLKNINICNDKKPIRSRDKDACDTSAQRGMCCCCDGVKCSNVDVVLVSTIWDLSSVRIFDIAPNYAWPAQQRHARSRPGMGLCQNIFNF